MSKKPSSLLALVIVLSTLLVSCGRTERPTPAAPTEDTRARPADDMTMVYVPGGEFRMGQTWSLQDRVHTVELDGFWIDQTEVTNAHYRRCVEAGTCRAPTTCNWGEPTYGDASKADHPVICVTWQAASDYCRWAGARLPTEAEWEYAARGPRAMIYPWGDDFDGTRMNSCDVNCPHEDQRNTDVDDGHALTAPVGSYPDGASWCGALDMAGNVWEWVADWHVPYPLTRQTNPTGPESGSEKLIRGGSWYENDEYGALRADNRHPFEPRDYNYLIGFRCIVPEKAAFSYWPIAAPDEQGMDDGLLAEMVDTIQEHDYDIDSVTIVRNGQLVLDEYFPPFAPDSKHIIHSCTKSIVSALIGIAIDQGYIEGVDQPVLDLFPGRAAANLDADKQGMRLEDLLTMSSGLECRDSYLYDWHGLSEMRRSDDWVQFMLDLPMAEPPGTRFEYCNGGSFLLSAILQEATGMSAQVFAEKNLFGPLGITDVDWPANPQGISIGWGEMHLKPHDMAKIGSLYLNGGRWEGQQIVPAGWVAVSIRAHITAGTLSDGYGYQWWVDTGGYYMALGYQGQYICVIPEKDMVVIFTSDLADRDFSLPETLLNEYIIPAAD